MKANGYDDLRVVVNLKAEDLEALEIPPEDAYVPTTLTTTTTTTTTTNKKQT